MAKINLLVSESDMNSFCAKWMQPSLEQFNIEYYDKNKKYDKKSTLLVVGCLSTSDWHETLYNDGYKVVVDNLWELPQPTKLTAHVAKNKNWFWYNESLWYRHRSLHQYNPVRTYNKTAFVPMNLKKDFRDKLFNIISKDSDQFLFSYRSLGHTLPGDIDTAEWQRHVNPDWYNSTYFSIVAETVVDHTLPLFITEKTFKPVAFRHPFIILGQPNVLRWLRYLGFETFNNLFDESYDTVSNIDNKLEMIDKNICNFLKTPYDALTEQKIAHNHNLFFDQTQVLDRIQQEIINPILNYAET